MAWANQDEPTGLARQDVGVTLEQVADQLYSIVPDDFVAARDDAVRQARADGNAPLATALAKLRRPTQGAWLANLLVREHVGQMTQLVELGSALREAQSSLDGDAMRELARQRQQVVTGLVAVARRTAAGQGHPVGVSAAAELESTLVAALADPDAARQMLAGRLTSSLSYAGLGFGQETAQQRSGRAAAARPAGGRRSPRPGAGAAGQAESRTAAVDEAERALAAARLAEAAADAATRLAGAGREQAISDLDAARGSAQQAAARAEAAKAELATALAQVERARSDAAQAKQDLAQAERQRSQARRTVEVARKGLERSLR